MKQQQLLIDKTTGRLSLLTILETFDSEPSVSDDDRQEDERKNRVSSYMTATLICGRPLSMNDISVQRFTKTEVIDHVIKR
jgi:hypothetical protein